jgi:hypothetical protein
LENFSRSKRPRATKLGNLERRLGAMGGRRTECGYALLGTEAPHRLVFACVLKKL